LDKIIKGQLEPFAMIEILANSHAETEFG